MEVDPICPVCGEGVEDVEHMLFRCEEAKQVWKYSPLRLEYMATPHLSFMEWLCNLAKSNTEVEWWNLFWATAWGIWLKRNRWCFEHKKMRVMDTISRAISIVGEYEKANEKPLQQIQLQTAHNGWEAPPSGVVKVNTDAAFKDGRLVGIGAVMRDSKGDILMSTCCKRSEVCEVDVGEAIAARHALLIGLEAGMTKFVLESDSLKLVNHLRKEQIDLSYFGNIVKEIIFMSKLCNSISFNHVRRSSNVVAHEMARISFQFEEMRVWVEEVPDEVNRFVLADFANLN